MKIMFKKYIIGILICSLTMVCEAANALKLTNIKPNIGQYLEITSIPKSYKVLNANAGDDSINQITFINTNSGQRMSITFSKYMKTKSQKQVNGIMAKIAKDHTSHNNKKITTKITSAKKFYAHNQTIPYYNIDQYINGKLWTRAMIGLIGNYNGKLIVIQSYSAPKKYNENEMKKFFGHLKLKPNSF